MQNLSVKNKFQQVYNTLFENNKLIFVGKIIELAAEKWPNNIAVECKDKSITYNELYFRSLELAKKLKELGVAPKDRVIIFYENSIEFYIAYFAIWNCAGVVAALNVFLSEKELDHIINDCKPKVIITSNSLLPKVQACSNLPSIITEIDLSSNLNKDYMYHSERLSLEPEEMAALLYTSGTTGLAKGVMLSSKNILTNVVQGMSLLKVTAKDRVLGILPLFHALMQNTCVWASCFLGGTVILVPKIDRKVIIEAIEKKPTVVVGVPALFGLFCLMKTLNFSSVNYFFSGGDALPNKIRMMFALIYKRKLCNGYGLTETSPLICVNTQDYMEETNNIGWPAYGIECQIRDENGSILPNNQIGTLCVKGDNVMLGYYNAPEATEKILSSGWLNTGDLAYRKNDGKIVISGRQKDLIINKGIKIYPQEVENVLMSHPSVTQAAVIGLDVENDQIPVAFVATRDLTNTNLIQEIKELCDRSLAKYKIPRKFIIKKELPVTSTGKVDKKVLKAELANEQN